MSFKQRKEDSCKGMNEYLYIGDFSEIFQIKVNLIDKN